MVEQLTSTQEKYSFTTISSIKHKNKLSINTGAYEDYNYPLNKLFFDLSSIQTGQSSNYQRETEKEREIRLIENLNFNKRKLNKEYQDKLNDLLQIKKNPDYSTMRKNMNKLIYQTDSNHNVYLTLPKCLKKRSLKYRNEPITLISEMKNKNETAEKKRISQSPIAKEQKQPKRDIFNLIPEFNKRSNDDKDNDYDFKNRIDNELNDQYETLSHLNEEEQRDLFEKLRTKIKFNRNRTETQTQTQSQNEEKKSRNDTLTLINIKNLSKEVNNKEEINQMMEVFDKYITKSELLKSIRMNKQLRTIGGLDGVDLFYYNAKRWSERKKTKKFKIQSEELQNKKDETKRILKLMVDSYDKLTDIMKRVKSTDTYNDLSLTNKKRKQNEKTIGNNTFLTSPDIYIYQSLH